MKSLHLFWIAVALTIGTSTQSCTKSSATEILSDGVTIETPTANVRLKAVTDKIIRVSASPDSKFPDDASLVALPVNEIPEFSVTQTDDSVYLTTSQLKAAVDKHTGAVTFLDKNGKKILQENDESRSFKPITVEGTGGYTVTQTFLSPDDNEGIYGLGQHQATSSTTKARTRSFSSTTPRCLIPFVVSTGNYGILWDSYSLCRWGNPDDYKQLGDVFTLYDNEGRKGALTGIYTDAKGDTMTRQEPQIYFEHLIRGDLNHVVNLPRDFNFYGSKVVYEGEIEPRESGTFDFIMYYSGYQTIYIDNKPVVEQRWRTAWNPNSYKFSVNLEKGKRTPIKIEWEPNGSVAYCGLRVYDPRDPKDQLNMSWWGEMQDGIDYYFIYGDDMDDVIKGYRNLTGKAPIMPKWAMGYWQSREKYNTRDEVLSTVAEFRKRNMPIDNIVIDWLHWQAGRMGQP